MSGTRVAYLVSLYPKLSHAFIEREVQALRRLGVTVDTFSVNAPGCEDLRTPLARDEARRTVVLKASKLRLLRMNAHFLVRHPRAWGHGLRVALRTGAPRPGHRLWQVFYLLEAVLLLTELRGRGHRHVHVHLANNAADIARLLVAVGRVLDGPAWRWSLSLHGPTEFEDVVGVDLVAKVRSAAFVACISEWLRRRVVELAGEDVADRLAIVRMSVEADGFPSAAALRSSRSGPVRVLFVGRLVADKNPALLVDAVRELRRQQVDVQATLVGSGPLVAALRARIADMQLGDAVELLGPRSQDELPQLYADADVFCLPSHAEGLPVVLMEALSSELPAVTTRITGIPELVRHEDSGLLVEPGALDELVSALRRLAEDPELRLRLGRAGRARVLEEFQPEPNARRLAALFSEVEA